jgi:hypothetical protein
MISDLINTYVSVHFSVHIPFIIVTVMYYYMCEWVLKGSKISFVRIFRRCNNSWQRYILELWSTRSYDENLLILNETTGVKIAMVQFT